MELDERIITRAIIDRYSKKFIEYTDVDTAIVGAGPAGLVAAYFLARAGRKVAVFERRLSVGGGMWGGGMMFNEIVVQDEGKEILDIFGVRTEGYEPGYHTADAVEAVTTICSHACRAGAKIFNCISVEDVVIREKVVTGLVINWTAVEMSHLHVDPLTVATRSIIDSTGHDMEVLKVIARKAGITFNTATGGIVGERSLWAERAERLTIENTKEICTNVYVAGMSANAACGGPRMGPVFGGMLLSGKKAAEMVIGR
jgi:sulfide-dependent adenosine diphosphate thiazole synthase